MKQRNEMMKSGGMPGGMHWITCRTYPSCVTLTSFSVESGASLIRLYFLG